MRLDAAYQNNSNNNIYTEIKLGREMMMKKAGFSAKKPLLRGRSLELLNSSELNCFLKFFNFPCKFGNLMY